MTKKSSVSNGFISILGSFPMQFAMFLTFVASVSLPRDEHGEIDPESYKLYNCVWIMHLASALVVLMNQHFPHALGVYKYMVNTCMTLFNVVVVINICMEFFDEGDEDAKPASLLGPVLEEGEEVVLEAPYEYDAAMLRGWFAIEVLMWLSIVISNVIFVAARSCSSIRILGTRSTAVVHSNTDMIEEQQILVCTFSSYIAPLIVTLCLQSFGFDAYPDVTNAVWEWLFNLLALQLIQSITVVYITFVPYRHDDEKESCYNKCMPAWHNILEVLLFLVLPAGFFAAYFTLLGTVETKTLFLYFTFTVIHTLFVTLWFLVILIDIFEGLKMQNVAERRHKIEVGAIKPNQVSKEVEHATAIRNEDPEEEEPKNMKENLVNENVLPSKRVDKPMRFREDMYSLLFVSLVKPQYKMYCDLVARTGDALPKDAGEKRPPLVNTD